MKKVFLLASAFIFSLAVLAQPKADDVLKVNTEKHEFGKIKQGVPVTTFFELKNLGKMPLVIEDVTASCGCTKPEKPKEPILPGQTYKLKVEYNANAMGNFVKDVNIKIAGIELPKVVKIAGEVITAEAFDAYTKEKEKEKAKNNGKSGK
jgi:uncharacterized protein DUF1573